jgi:hypothetical protein
MKRPVSTKKIIANTDPYLRRNQSMSYQVYKLLHVLGIMLLFFGFGGVLIPNLSGFKLAGKAKLIAFITHGLGMLLLLVAGFGLLAKLGLDGIPGWVIVKLIVWLLLGVGIALAKRKPTIISLLILLALAMVAPYAAIFKNLP